MKNLTAWFSVLLLTVLAFAPGLSGAFLFDDYPNIVNNAAIRITQIDFNALSAVLAGPTAGPLGRPLSVLSFALNHYFFGLDPFAYKVVNLIIHLVNGLLVGWLVHLLLSHLPEKPFQTSSRSVAIWVAAIWLLHPINVAPIVLTVQRMTLLSGMFLLLALVAHTKWLTSGSARWAWVISAWLIFWPAAVLSKETGLLFPCYAFVVTLLLRRERLLSMLAAGFGITVVMATIVIGYLGLGWLESGYAMRSFTLWERLLTEARVLWFYLEQIVLPTHTDFGIFLDDFPVSSSLLQPPQTAFALVGWLGAIFLLTKFWRRQPLACFGMAWFLVGHLLESTFLPLEIAFEYRNYLPSLGPIVVCASLGMQFFSRLRLDYPRQTIFAAALLPVAMAAMLTWMRADQWSDALRGYQIEAMHHPRSARANYTLALTLMQSGRGDVGDPFGARLVSYHFSVAADADPAFKLAYLGLLSWACASGRQIEPDWLDEFASRLQKTAFGPQDRDLPQNIAKQLLTMPQCLSREQALRLFDSGSRNERIGDAVKARFLEAAGDHELLVSLDPYSARAYFLRASTLDAGNIRLKEKIAGLGPET